MEIGKFGHPGRIPGYPPPSDPPPGRGTEAPQVAPAERVYQGDVLRREAQPAVEDYAKLARNAPQGAADPGAVRSSVPAHEALAAYRTTTGLDPAAELLPRIDRFV